MTLVKSMRVNPSRAGVNVINQSSQDSEEDDEDVDEASTEVGVDDATIEDEDLDLPLLEPPHPVNATTRVKIRVLVPKNVFIMYAPDH